MNHLTLVQLQEVMAREAKAEEDLHVEGCAICRAMIAELRRVDGTLRALPPEATGEDFAEKVMRRLGLPGSPSIVWVLFKNLAPVFALLLVGVIAVVSLNYFGAFEGSGLQQSASTLQSASGWFGSQVARGTSTLNHWLETNLAFAFGKSSYGLTVFTVLFLALVALVDKYLLMPMMRKRGM